jgi:hypothetical protein
MSLLIKQRNSSEIPFTNSEEKIPFNLLIVERKTKNDCAQTAKRESGEREPSSASAFKSEEPVWPCRSSQKAKEVKKEKRG